jgi:transposase
MIAAMHGRRAGAKAIFDRLRLQHPDFPGSLSAVKRLCARLSRERGIAPEEVAIPVETEAGHIAQVDFSFVGKLYDPEHGVPRKCWLFLMTLGYSGTCTASSS